MKKLNEEFERFKYLYDIEYRLSMLKLLIASRKF